MPPSRSRDVLDARVRSMFKEAFLSRLSMLTRPSATFTTVGVKKTFALLFSCFLLGACAVEDVTPAQPNTSDPAAATPEADDAEELGENSQAVVSCGTAFDCRSNPPPPRSDGRAWLFYGSKYCQSTRVISCRFVPSGLSASWPTVIANVVPTTCTTCTSNAGLTSNCAISASYGFSSTTWSCVAP